ncbi:hypothetical protein NX059_011018 [Plenodomus lindquistii]|nr:hypothetical protein NX059_011018 [Plenodomus lindquistii]
MRSIAPWMLILASGVAGRLFADDAYLKSAGDASTIVKASPASPPHQHVPLHTPAAEAQNLELRQVPNAAANPAVPAPADDPTSTQPVPPNAATSVLASADAALPAPGMAFPAASATSSTTGSPVSPTLANPAAAATSATRTSSLIAAINPPAVAPVDPAAKPGTEDGASATTTPAPVPGAPVGDDYATVHWVETTIGGTYSTWVPVTNTVHFESRTPGPPPGRGEIGLGTIKGEAGKTKTIYAGAAPTQAAVWMRGVAAAVGVGVVGIVV